MSLGREETVCDLLPDDPDGHQLGCYLRQAGRDRGGPRKVRANAGQSSERACDTRLPLHDTRPAHGPRGPDEEGRRVAAVQSTGIRRLQGAAPGPALAVGKPLRLFSLLQRSLSMSISS